jgi:hypothetical protein
MLVKLTVEADDACTTGSKITDRHRATASGDPWYCIEVREGVLSGLAQAVCGKFVLRMQK